jgi:hypothetical protein
MMCMSINVVLPCDFIISMSFFKNYNLPSCATCQYPKQQKNVSLNMS